MIPHNQYFPHNAQKNALLPFHLRQEKPYGLRPNYSYFFIERFIERIETRKSAMLA